jgi:creatinine amidohydrolase
LKIQWQICSGPTYLDIHAGEDATSNMQKYFPGLVNIEKAKTLLPTDLTIDDFKEWHKGRDVARNITPLGYFGAPANFEQINYEIDFIEGYSRFASINLIKYLLGLKKGTAVGR